ncbi:MAG: diacylglycerol/lipid kinase family protein [Hyphomicrobium sp.]
MRRFFVPRRWKVAVTPRRRFGLVYNSRAGLALPRLLDSVVAELGKNGADVFQVPARSAAEATERVAEAAAKNVCDAIIAAGGDGTFRAVATGAVNSPLPVGVIPLGTGNVIARELGLPWRPKALADVLTMGPRVQAQAGLVNGAPFFLMVGAGFDGRIIAGLNYKAKRLFGRAAFAAPVVKALAEAPQSFDVAVDGAEFRASWVVVARARRYGGSFVLSNDTAIGTSSMIAVIIAAETRGQLVQASLALARGSLADELARPSFVQVVRADVVEIGRRTEAPVEIDGDEAGVSPISIQRNGPLVDVIAPPEHPHAQVAEIANRHTNHLL